MAMEGGRLVEQLRSVRVSIEMSHHELDLAAMSYSSQFLTK